MKSEFEQFLSHFHDVLEGVEQHKVFVRGREFQEASILTLQALLTECVDKKSEAIKNSQEDVANTFLSFGCVVKAAIEEFSFYVALKDDRVDEAWDHLINAESLAADAIKAHMSANHLLEYIDYLRTLELLFPKPTFLSTGFIVERSECSVCGIEYGECDHVQGRPYMGTLCARIITKGTAREVSRVADPADKHCRVERFADGKTWRNAFTHRIIPAENATVSPDERVVEGRIF